MEQKAFVKEKSLQVLGRPNLLLESLHELSERQPQDTAELPLWQERAFLKGFALSRLSRKSEAEIWFKKLPSSFAPRVRAEEALHKLNFGEFIEAATHFREALNDIRLEDFYSICTILGGLSLALIHQGEFREAEKCIKDRQRLLRMSPCPPLEFGTKLYEILLLLEGNEFNKVSEMLRETLGKEKEDSINGFFLKHLSLRLHLERNELAAAAIVLQQLRSQNIPSGALNVEIEEIEWQLRSKKYDEALQLIQKYEQDPAYQTDRFLNFRINVLKAQALYQKQEFPEAFRLITAAVTEAERRHYRPGMTWALFHGAGIAQASGNLLQGKIFLRQGERLTSQLNLRSRFACFSYMAEVAESRQSSGLQLLGLVKRQEIGPELEYYLSTYNLLNDISLEVSSREGQESVAEPSLRRQLFREAGVFWFQKEETLFVNLGNAKSKIIGFKGTAVLLGAFRLLWNSFQFNDLGSTLKELHQVRSNSTFREELHAGAAKMLISRLRSHLMGSGLKVVYDRETGRYSLVSELPPYSVLSQRGNSAAGKGRDKESEILARIAMEPFVSTRTLCDEFGVSRQALHPFLKSLTRQKKVRTVRRGPVSGYIFIRS
jgi:tetratricopeptide (TPR) repeat protein